MIGGRCRDASRKAVLHARPGGSADYWCTISCHMVSFRSRFCDCMREASPTLRKLALECGTCENMKHAENSNQRGSNG